MNRIKIWEEVLQGLMTRYKARVPDVSAILNAMKEEHVIAADDDIQNDHIAFRSLGVPHLGIASMEKVFLHYGYKKMDYYNFAEKKLNAYWYAPPTDSLPRIFLSELRVTDLSAEAQAIVYSYTSTITSDPVDALNLDDAEAVDQFLHSPLWSTPTLSDYKKLSDESEYAAWVIFNRYYLNHYTLSVHDLKEGLNTIALFNQFLERRGFRLNDAGGKIKQSPDGDLLQSSTVAGQVEAVFAGGETIMIPGSYVEFAERRILEAYKNLPLAEIKREHRREGFEALNADKIFESTYQSQINKS